jgi:alkanesulfonate monooxygenase SsuD/methylene tetrahydromethanopterin reductase-like flavin-dependent oxidoreductase (luciferase family)
MASEYLSANYAQDFTKLAPRYALAGDPAQCRARLAAYIEAGAERVVLAPAWSAPADTDRSVELMAQSVMPTFR